MAPEGVELSNEFDLVHQQLELQAAGYGLQALSGRRLEPDGACRQQPAARSLPYSNRSACTGSSRDAWRDG
jgi:hypothetical protein